MACCSTKKSAKNYFLVLGTGFQFGRLSASILVDKSLEYWAVGENRILRSSIQKNKLLLNQKPFSRVKRFAEI